MQPLPSRFDPRSVEAASRAFWSSRGLLLAEGVVGTGTGPVVHQFLGTVYPLDGELATLQRLIAADAESRYLGLTGRRTWTTIQLAAPGPTDELSHVFQRAAGRGVPSLGAA